MAIVGAANVSDWDSRGPADRSARPVGWQLNRLRSQLDALSDEQDERASFIYQCRCTLANLLPVALREQSVMICRLRWSSFVDSAELAD